MQFHLDTHHRRDCFAGDVVVGGTAAAAQHNGIGSGERQPDGLDHSTEVVAHLDLVGGLDTGQSELLADEGRVGIDDLAEQQFRADGDDFTPHGSPSFESGPPRRSTGSR